MPDRPQFTPQMPFDRDVPIMRGCGTAIFYAKWNPNRSPGRPPKDRAVVRQCPTFHCRSAFAQFNVEIETGVLPDGVELNTIRQGNYATFELTTSKLPPLGQSSEPARLTFKVTCITQGNTSVLPHHAKKTKLGVDIPEDEQYLPYLQYWKPDTKVFYVDVTVYLSDMPWLSGPNDELRITCEVGRYIAEDITINTTLEWEPNYVVWWGLISVPLSVIDLFGGAYDDTTEGRRLGTWCNYPIYLLDEWGQVDLTKPTGLYAKFPGAGELVEGMNYSGLCCQGPVTVHGVPIRSGNSGIEVYLRFDASWSSKYFNGWWNGPEVRLVFPITILDKFMPRGRAVVLRKIPEHVEDRFLMSTPGADLGDNSLAGSWQNESTLTPDNQPLPEGGNVVPPDPKPAPNPFIPEGPTGPNTPPPPVDPTDPTDPQPQPPYDWSHDGPTGAVIIDETTEGDGAQLSLIPGVSNEDGYPSRPYGASGYPPIYEELEVPSIDIGIDPSQRPLDLAPYYVGPGIRNETTGVGDTGARSAWSYPYLYNPSPDVDVPSIDIGINPTSLPLALAPYTVGPGVRNETSVIADTGIRSAFGYPYLYDPTPEVNVPSVEWHTEGDPRFDQVPAGVPFNRIPADSPPTGGCPWLSAFGYPYAYNPTAEALVPSVSLDDPVGSMPLSTNGYFNSAFGYPYFYNPTPEAVVPSIDIEPSDWINPLEAVTLQRGMIESAFGYPYLYNPTPDVDVPSIEIDTDPSTLPLALAEYPVGIGIPHPGYPGSEPSILSAFGYPYLYDPTIEVFIPPLWDWLGPIVINSALGFVYPYNFAADVNVPSVSIETTPTARTPFLTGQLPGYQVDLTLLFPGPEEIVIETVDDDWPWNQPFTAAYGPRKPIKSAWGWKYDYDPTPEIVVAPVAEMEPVLTGVATTPYPVDTTHIPHEGFPGADPQIVSAIAIKPAYNPTIDVNVPTTIIELSSNPSVPFTTA